MRQYSFFHTPLEKELLIAKIRANPSLKRIFKLKKNITEKVNHDIIERNDGLIENFSTIFITGKQGTFKSSVALYLSQRFDKTYNLERTCFQYGEFRDKLGKSTPKQWFILDEEVFKHGIGSLRIIQEINTLIETLRKRQNSMIIVTPEKKYFDEELFTYTLETIDSCIIAICPYNEKEHDPRTCACAKNNLSTIQQLIVRCAVKSQNLYLGFYLAKIKWGHEDWKQYEEIKEEFMNKIVTGNVETTDYKRFARKIMLDEEYPDYNKSQKSLRLLIQKNMPNLTVAEMDLIAEQIKIFQKQEKKEDEPK